MPSISDVIIVNTSSVEGMPVKKYLKPVSAHLVTGINIFGDFLGSLTDVFGGQSKTYERQLSRLYRDATQKIKTAAYETGANAVLGFRIDIDEISGKGKSMLMINATGTAVILDNPPAETKQNKNDNGGLITAERMQVLRKKEELLANAAAGSLEMKESTWNFVTENAIEELYPFVMQKLLPALQHHELNQTDEGDFLRFFDIYLEALPDATKKTLLYGSLATEKHQAVLRKLFHIIEQMHLFDINHVQKLMAEADFSARKRSVRASQADKPFYVNEDISELISLCEVIKKTFPERGERIQKQGFLSSKSKDMWKCECGKTNEIDTHCPGCKKDIFGFYKYESSPVEAENYLAKKIKMLSEQLGNP